MTVPAWDLFGMPAMVASSADDLSAAVIVRAETQTAVQVRNVFVFIINIRKIELRARSICRFVLFR
jgi:hypothetical protein